MKKKKYLILIFCITALQYVSAQEILPNITVKNFNGKIIVSWQNTYNIPVTNISIQRSFDSLKNFSTIGTVLNPQNLENGFADDKPPYSKMYYRVFISFEGGSYTFSSTVRPVKIPAFKKEIPVTTEEISFNPADSIEINQKDTSGNLTENNPILPRIQWQVSPLKDSIGKLPPKKDSIIIKIDPDAITYPSQRIYTGKENNLVIYLHNAAVKKYTVKFFDENDIFLFELTKLREEYLIIERVNFVHAGWFHFELFENGKLIEKNKFFIGKDGKSINSEQNKKYN